MNEILKLSTPLLRNENWRIREAIHCNRSTTPKKASLWKYVAKDLDLKGYYEGLLKLFQSEDLWQEVQIMVQSERMPSCQFEDGTNRFASNTYCISKGVEDGDGDGDCDGNGNGVSNAETSLNTSKGNETTIGCIRHVPEIMMRVYAYLSLGDRIYRLSLVDRGFASDKLRSGIVSATYGSGFNLHQALLELKRWAVEEMRKDFIDARAEIGEPITGRATRALFSSKQNEWRHMRRSVKISRMLDAAKLTDSEPLLYVRSNLKNTLVVPGKRREWMRRHVEQFFGGDDWEPQQCKETRGRSGQSWWTSIALVETFLRRYFFDGRINRLEQLMAEVGFARDYEQYKECQFWSSNEIGTNEKLVWCLPDLSPGCNLLLSGHPDDTEDAAAGTFGAWKEHSFAPCRNCRKFYEQSKTTVVRCRHGHQRHFCNACYDRLLHSAPDSSEGFTDTGTDTGIGGDVHLVELRGLICGHCRRIDSSRDRRR